MPLHIRHIGSERLGDILHQRGGEVLSAFHKLLACGSGQEANACAASLPHASGVADLPHEFFKGRELAEDCLCAGAFKPGLDGCAHAADLHRLVHTHALLTKLVVFVGEHGCACDVGADDWDKCRGGVGQTLRRTVGHRFHEAEEPALVDLFNRVKLVVSHALEFADDLETLHLLAGLVGLGGDLLRGNLAEVGLVVEGTVRERDFFSRGF